MTSPSKCGVCIVVENMSVPADPRVWKEARALTAAGYSVSVVCPKAPGFESSYESREGIQIYRHRTYQGTRLIGYVFEYVWALLAEFWLVVKVYTSTRFSVLQACNPPDTIFLIALVLKLFGVRFIFDQHDPVPEFYEARFGREGFLYRLVCLAERLTFQAADAVLVTNESCRELAFARGAVPPDRCFIVRNCPNLRDFTTGTARTELKEGYKHLVAYVGVMGSQDGIGLLLESIEHLVFAQGRHDTLFVLIGGGPELSTMKARAMERGLGPWVRFTGPVYGQDLRAYLFTADVGVAPDPDNVFNTKLTMIKILEYMACGLPIVLYDLIEGRRSAGDAALYATGNSTSQFAERISMLLDSEHLRQGLGEIGRRRILKGLNWETETRTLLAAYDRVLNGNATVSPRDARPSPIRSNVG